MTPREKKLETALFALLAGIDEAGIDHGGEMGDCAKVSAAMRGGDAEAARTECTCAARALDTAVGWARDALVTPPSLSPEEVREAAAKVALNVYGDAVAALGPDEPSVVGEKIASAIRSLDLTPAKEGK